MFSGDWLGRNIRTPKRKKITNSNVFKNVRKKYSFFCGKFFLFLIFFFNFCKKENYHKMQKQTPTHTEHKTPSIKIEFSLFVFVLVVAKFNQYSPDKHTNKQQTLTVHRNILERNQQKNKNPFFFCKIQYEIIIKNVCLCCSTTTTKNSTKN